MSEERKRPIKQFVVLQAYGGYRKGDKIQPTGMYRDILVRRGLIKEIKDEPVPVLELHSSPPPMNRMISTAALANRGGRRR